MDLVIDMDNEILFDNVYASDFDEYSENEYNVRSDHDSDVVNYQTIEDDTISENKVIDEDQILSVLNEINEKIGVLENDDRDSEPVQVVISSDNFRDNNVSDNQITSVSDNIISKPLNEYTVSESLLSLLVVSVFVAGLAYVIKRSVFRWN